MFTKRCTCPLSSRSSRAKPGYCRSRFSSSSLIVPPLAVSVRWPPVTFCTNGGTRTSTGMTTWSLDRDGDRGLDRGLEMRHAAELVVVNQLGNGRMVAAHLAFRIAPHAHLTDPHVERVEQQQPAVDALADAQDQLDRLDRLDHTYEARQHAEDAGL